MKPINQSNDKYLIPKVQHLTTNGLLIGWNMTINRKNEDPSYIGFINVNDHYSNHASYINECEIVLKPVFKEA
jgi:hypothetical protein